MTTAIFASTFAGSNEAPSKPSGWMRRILSALIESRTRAQRWSCAVTRLSSPTWGAGKSIPRSS